VPTTSKLLAAFDPQNPLCPSGDFLVLIREEGCTSFYGLKSGRQQLYGLVVYLGGSITEADIFAKLVDSGFQIEDVAKALSLICSYMDKIRGAQIGNVIRVKELNSDASIDYELEVVARTPAGFQWPDECS